jgi:hypothetical protein
VSPCHQRRTPSYDEPLHRPITLHLPLNGGRHVEKRSTPRTTVRKVPPCDAQLPHAKGSPDLPCSNLDDLPLATAAMNLPPTAVEGPPLHGRRLGGDRCPPSQTDVVGCHRPPLPCRCRETYERGGGDASATGKGAPLCHHHQEGNAYRLWWRCGEERRGAGRGQRRSLGFGALESPSEGATRGEDIPLSGDVL